MEIQKKEKFRRQLLRLCAVILVIAGGILWHYCNDPWGYYHKVSPAEAAVRNRVIRTAESYLGCNEADGSHSRIIDIYNSQEALPQDYVVKYTDSWCATFVSAVAIRSSVTQVVPLECGCQRHIELFRQMGIWEEDDTIIPQPGDIIFYDWDQTGFGDATGWADHVGIVVGTKWPFLKVIEGNYDDCVSYRYLLIGHRQIRGYGRPDYASLVK